MKVRLKGKTAVNALCFWSDGDDGNTSNKRDNNGHDNGGNPGSTLNTVVVLPIQAVREVHARRYLLRHTALELNVTHRGSFFLNFDTASIRATVCKTVKRLRPPALRYMWVRPPAQEARVGPWTELWRLGRMTNFDYLMVLNSIAGRTYNDLSQFPVLPWVLSEAALSADTLDLLLPHMYRNLSLPVGALLEEPREKAVERYETLKEMDIPHPFMHGTHYCNTGTVLYYLLRLEPFSSLASALATGTSSSSSSRSSRSGGSRNRGLLENAPYYDHPDRLFHSVTETWGNCLRSSSDVKELIPAMFTNPSVLTNGNGCTFGNRQDGDTVDAVVLPPWAQGEPIMLYLLTLYSPIIHLYYHVSYIYVHPLYM